MPRIIQKHPGLIAFGLWCAVVFLLGLSTTFPAVRFHQEQAARVLQTRAQILAPMVQFLKASAEEELGLTADDLSDPRPLQALLRTSTLEGVMDIHLLDGQGYALDSLDTPPALDETELTSLASRQASASFLGRQGSPRWDMTPAGAGLPLVEILVPLFHKDGRRFAGVAAYLVDGRPAAAEITAIGWQTVRLAGAVFILGALTFSGLWWWAWTRLEQNRRELSARNLALGRLNRELALLAKTSAVGALTSHLLHGLKNPLAGLREFTRRPAGDQPDDEEWDMARESTLRMSDMIDETISVLREDQAEDSPEVTVNELLHSLRHRYTDLAARRGAHLLVSDAPPARCSSLRGRLLRLILANLLDNALSALPARAGEISVQTVIEDGAIVCRVRDNGPGLPPERASRPFDAAPSAKAGGSGLGLALSRLLAITAQAELVLETTGPQGTSFAVRLPPDPA